MFLSADTVATDDDFQSPAPLTPGLITLHGNRLDWLAHAVMQWLAQHPLAPLEQEVVLVQSNGIAEWFKMEMAATTGVCAATRVELPSRFLWRTYRQVLGAAAVPRDSPLDKIPMTWRLMKVLPGLLELHDFAPVRGYLKPEEPERHLQLAAKLADLFDQYQNYRADWLQAWHAGRDVLIGHNGVEVPVPDEQRWQPLLWRAVLDTLEPGREQAIRPYLHQKVLERLQRPDAHYTGRVARRVVVFGMSHMPWSTLQVLAALSRYTQVLLAVPNPCRYYWGDIMDGRDLFRSQRQRQSPRADQPLLMNVPLQDMHHHAHPLLAAWGRQGRDFIRLLDEVDDAAQTRKDFPALKIDLFDEDDSDDATPMLLQVQRLIRDLEPLPLPGDAAVVPRPLPVHDRSITFHVAHSRVRELEILHDQLLHWLNPAHTPAGMAPLQPRDVVVMVPDIEQMAPAIRAVFDQYKRSDPRHIPYDIADVSAKSSSPLILALEWLLKLPRQRCGMSELVDLLEVPAVAARFGIDNADLPTLTQWMEGAGIRWGLNEAHRQALGLGACGDQNSAWFGLQRMLLGYAVGDAALDLNTTGTPWQHIAPYAEVGGLDAELAGGLAHLLRTLMDWVAQTARTATPLLWAERARALLDALFLATDDTDRAVLGLLEDGLATWLQACEQARFDEPLPLADFAQAWLEAIEVPSLEHKFRAGGVTFCTLMPMRAVPFEVVCLLGMNDGDYPRRTLYSDFDLMRQKGQYRSGDRSRQYDDRQLMLEALLSARRALYIGWSGRSVRDNTEQPPSVLVSQLRDYLGALWGEDAIQQRTTEHPLQPFSRRYFEDGSALATYAHEWRSLHSTAANAGDEGETPATLMPQPVPPLPAFVPDPEVPLTFQRLDWFLRNPVKAFFRDRFAIAFERDEEPDADVEPFQIDGLERYQLLQQQTGAWPAGLDASGLKAHVQRALERQRLAGALPVKALGEREQAELGTVLDAMAEAWHQAQCDYPRPAPRLAVRHRHQDVVLEDWVDGLHLSDAGADTPVWLVLQASKWLDKKGEPRPDKLLPLWLRLLGAAALGQPVGARAVGQDAWLDIRPMPTDTAQAQLGMVLEAWRAGMQRPLPVPLKTALALAPDPGNLTKARTAYEGDSFGAGLQPEGAEPCLARQYPDFAALQQDGQLAEWAQRLYVPLLDWAKDHVTPHAY